MGCKVSKGGMQKLYLKVKILDLFDSLALFPFTKYNIFFESIDFLAKNLTNTLTWKLDNPYYHNIEGRYIHNT
jgi:hypothetical protein